ncbi:hypothetical protein ACIBVL_31545 [Streptomyces sp. NPDC049687]|uniref:hypothetical protein n=1 Tax=Streptomyces sp. NPDC049687 TaxID=3365596 RepID=UPI0037A9B38A
MADGTRATGKTFAKGYARQITGISLKDAMARRRSLGAHLPRPDLRRPPAGRRRRPDLRRPLLEARGRGNLGRLACDRLALVDLDTGRKRWCPTNKGEMGETDTVAVGVESVARPPAGYPVRPDRPRLVP